MKILKNINYRLVLKRLKIAYWLLKLVGIIWKLLSMAFNYRPVTIMHVKFPKMDFKI